MMQEDLEEIRKLVLRVAEIEKAVAEKERQSLMTQNPCREETLKETLTKNSIVSKQMADFNTQHLSKLVLKKLDEFKAKSGKMRNFFGILNKVEKKDIAVCGGAVRDWWLLREPKDVDLVVNCSEEIIGMLSNNFKHTRSQFNGFMFDVAGTKVDLWRLQDSWTFSQNPLQEKTWGNLLYSFPFNIDSVLVFGDGQVKENGFFDGLNRREIELLNPHNKNQETNIIKRGISFQEKYGEKYGFTLGPKLKAEIDKHLRKGGIDYSKIGGAVQQMGSSN